MSENDKARTYDTAASKIEEAASLLSDAMHEELDEQDRQKIREVRDRARAAKSQMQNRASEYDPGVSDGRTDIPAELESYLPGDELRLSWEFGREEEGRLSGAKTTIDGDECTVTITWEVGNVVVEHQGQAQIVQPYDSTPLLEVFAEQIHQVDRGNV